MLLTADVLKLKCLYFKYALLVTQAESYGIECKVTEYTELLDALDFYFDVISKSSTYNWTCDCRVRPYLDKYDLTVTQCVRETIINTGV